MRGRIVRGGRVVARVLVVWVVSVLALRLLDLWLTGFAMPAFWQPTVIALAFGVLSAVLWPLIVRVALPLALYTLGIGSFLLLGAALLALSFVIPGVVITDIGTAVIVVVAMSAVAALVSSLLGLDEDELFYRRAARRSPDGVPDDRPPGVLFLQVDGLGYETVRRAVRDGDMPTFARWLGEGSHALTSWHCDWSSQTGASVCGILHGRNDDILGFRWYEKDRDHIMACAHPEDAAEIERRHSDGRGLLAVDGAGRGNLFTGDAPHVSLTMSAVPLLAGKGRRGLRRDGPGAGYYTYFANPYNAIRTLGSGIADIAREISASTRQRRAGVRPRIDRGGLYPFARAGTNVIARDVVVSAVIGDMLAGRSCVYADFLGYDEVAHHSGIERFDALAVLREIDQQIGRLHRATELAPRRYLLVALSDHGQTQGQAFANRFGESVEQLVGRLCGGDPPDRSAKRAARRPAETWQVGAAFAEVSAGAGPVARRLRAGVARTRRDHPRTATGEPGAVTRVAPGVVAVASGHVAMVSFVEYEGRVELETIEREFPDLLPALIDHPGVGFALVRTAADGPVVFGRDGVHRLATGEVLGADPLAPYGEHAADLVRRVDGFAHCPDIMLNSRYDAATDEASPFEVHVGSHGGLGGPQARGFLLSPVEMPTPGEIVGAEALHRLFRGWLTSLGHPEPAEHAESGASASSLTR
ncbi:MAG TPA: phage holin family protein [Pseudonocardia sp.]